MTPTVPPVGTQTTTAWPELDLSAWADTEVTFHLWTQIVGKIRMALEPMVNHWWQVTLYVSGRGLTTSLMHGGTTGLEIEFDLVDHVLELRTTDGRRRHVPLEPRSVASFYEATMGALDELGVRVQILARPVEMVESIPFAQDDAHASYDARAVHRFWLALVHVHRVMTRFRSRFAGKVSPVHFFWGAADLAVTRFSGRSAPTYAGPGAPHCATWVMELAYSHEESSCGFWPGGSDEGSFYSYAYPAPDGFADWPVVPDAAYYDGELGEFLLPYRAVRTAEKPDELLLSFFQSTYEAAAELGHWDRASLEGNPVRRTPR
ncbi:MAG TPA: DUF5996 family protein [Acidimicrobiales bacterium]|nr:DUF5996 family protein [Acidimicrobiales bacterium]